MTSVRDNIQSMMEKKLCYTLNYSQLKRICVNRSFKCKLRLSPFNEMESNVLTLPNTEHLNILMVVRASYLQQVENQTEKNRKSSNESEPSSSSTNKSDSYSSEENLLSKHKNQKNTTKNALNNCNSINNVTSTFNNNSYIRRETQNGPVPPLNLPPVPPPNVPVPPPNARILQGNNRRRRRRRRNT